MDDLHLRSRSKSVLMLFLVAIEIGNGFASNIVFTEEPQDTVIVYGEDLFLSCDAYITTATGISSDLQYSWRYLGNSVPAKSSMFANHTVLVPNLTEFDVGNYTCVVVDTATEEMLESRHARVLHAFITMFELSPLSINAMEDQLVSFQCITGQSAPSPEIFWERDGILYEGGRQYSATYGESGLLSNTRQYSMKLEFVAKPYKDGSYNCVSKNPRLNIEVRSFSASLSTTERESAPYVMVELVVPEVVAPYNQPFLLDCPIAGKPRVSVMWYKDDVQIQNSQSFLVLQNASLHTPTAQLGDAGVYYCRGFNEHGEIRSADVTVIVGMLDLTFQKPPDNLYLIAGQPGILQCIPPVSVPMANVTWYKDDKLLVPRTGEQSVIVQRTNSNSWNVVFSEVQKIDEGEYFCVATNNYAVPSTRTSRVVTIQVGGAPTFTDPPTGLTIQKGHLAQLQCYMSGDPFPTVIWLFENTVLVPSETVSFREHNQELWIGNIHKGYEGTYTCMASNRYGSIQSRVYIKVLIPPLVLQPIGNLTVSAGEAAIIPCSVYSDPKPTITWSKDGVPVLLGNHMTQLQDGLYINTVLEDDDGQYTCQAVNVAGSMSTTGYLTVQILPHFNVRPISQTVTIGHNATLNCVANGYPKPDINWVFNGSSLFPASVLLSLNKQQLLLMEVNWSHVGEYQCQAQNIEGFSTSTATIKLQVPPKIDKVDGVPILYNGENLQLRCLATGVPMPSITWQLDRAPIVESQDGRVTFPDRGVLSVKFTSLDDAGRYTCRVSNSAGVSEKSIDVFIIVRPSAPFLTNAEVMTATSVKLTWSLDQVRPQTPIDHLLIYYRKRTDATLQVYPREVTPSLTRFVVPDLQPASEYLFSVSAVNDAGQSDQSNVLNVQTYDAGPSEPRNLEASVVIATNITLIWEIPFTTNGEIRRYRVLYNERNSNNYFEKVVTSLGDASESYTIVDLIPYTWYSVQVQAATMQDNQTLWGNMSQSIDVRTTQAAPTGSPRETLAQPVSSSVIQVMWESVLQEKQNGPIKRYYVKYWLLSDMSLLGELVSDSLDLKLNVSNLQSWTWYEFQVIAQNDAGHSTPGEMVRARTLPSIPVGAPVNVKVTNTSATTITVSWRLPLVEERNSELAGVIVQYWKIGETTVTALTVSGSSQLSHVISQLVPWSEYIIRVAAFTRQVEPGTGPFSNNVTITTQEGVPGPVSDITAASTSTTISLSWQPPTSPNGIVIDYLITYFSTGALVTNIGQSSDALLNRITSAILRNSSLVSEIFVDWSENITRQDVTTLVKFCDTVSEKGNMSGINTTSFQQLNGLSDVLLLWSDSEQVTLETTCDFVESVKLNLTELSSNNIDKTLPVFNVTSTTNQVTLKKLEPFTQYNISVSPATVAGRGEPVSITTATVQAPPTPSSTTRRAPPVPTTAVPSLSLAEKADNSVNVPVVVGGGVAGLVAILMILLVGGCVFLRCRRRYEEEKAHVIKAEQTEDPYRQYDTRSSQMAAAAADGTDTDSHISHVDVYRNAVHYGKSHHGSEVVTKRKQPFVTGGSGQIALENPNFVDFNPAPTIKSNPAYIDEQGTSEQESVTVSMALSEENLGEGTLKRISRMKRSDAAAIARLHHLSQPQDIAAIGRLPPPPGMGSSSDTPNLIDTDMEVVYNERTAL